MFPGSLNAQANPGMVSVNGVPLDAGTRLTRTGWCPSGSLIPPKCPVAASRQAEASAFALIWSNSAWVIAPESSSAFAEAISSAALDPAEPPATDLMYSA